MGWFTAPRDVDETLRLVQAFQFTDEHGEVRGLRYYRCHRYIHIPYSQVCPAGWRPGKKTMKPDPKVGQAH